MLRTIKNKVQNFINSESGMGVIEVVLIIMVLVGLALLFKSEITAIATSIFTALKKQVQKF